jgi:hypothetical protein
MTEEIQGPDPTLSSDANDSTYAVVTDDEPQNPPSGHRVEQTLGKPSGSPTAPAPVKKTSTSSSTSSA